MARRKGIKGVRGVRVRSRKLFGRHVSKGAPVADEDCKPGTYERPPICVHKKRKGEGIDVLSQRINVFGGLTNAKTNKK